MNPNNVRPCEKNLSTLSTRFVHLPIIKHEVNFMIYSPNLPIMISNAKTWLNRYAVQKDSFSSWNTMKQMFSVDYSGFTLLRRNRRCPWGRPSPGR